MDLQGQSKIHFNIVVDHFQTNSLTRCVVVVGMPYPNPKDPILQEKLNYFNAKRFNHPNKIEQHNNNNNNNNNKIIEKRDDKIEGKTFTNAEYLENICMKAVNQSIGISHSYPFKGPSFDVVLNTTLTVEVLRKVHPTR
jgi:hypothetical protein